MFRVGFYLPSDISDVHVRCANLTVELSIPELFHYLLAAIDPSRMSGEQPENLVQHEAFKGVLVSLLARSLDKNTLRGFEEMNEALRERAEALPKGSELRTSGNLHG
jgi:hypothetical protein